MLSHVLSAWWFYPAVLLLFAVVFGRRIMNERQPTIEGDALDGTATVVRLEPRARGDDGSKHRVMLELRIQIPGRDAYDLTMTREVHVVYLPRVQPGSVIPVKVDPANPDRVRLELAQ